MSFLFEGDTSLTLIQRLMPEYVSDASQRANAWIDFQTSEQAFRVKRSIEYHNDTIASDDEIFQDAIVVAYMSIECGDFEYRDDIRFVAYLKKVAFHKIKEAQKRSEKISSLDEDTLPDLENVEAFVIDKLFSEELLDRMQQILPARRFQVLTFYYIEELSFSEIAERLGISEVLVRQDKRRAIDKLREVFGINGENWD